MLEINIVPIPTTTTHPGLQLWLSLPMLAVEAAVAAVAPGRNPWCPCCWPGIVAHLVDRAGWLIHSRANHEPFSIAMPHRCGSWALPFPPYYKQRLWHARLASGKITLPRAEFINSIYLLQKKPEKRPFQLNSQISRDYNYSNYHSKKLFCMFHSKLNYINASEWEGGGEAADRTPHRQPPEHSSEHSATAPSWPGRCKGRGGGEASLLPPATMESILIYRNVFLKKSCCFCVQSGSSTTVKIAQIPKYDIFHLTSFLFSGKWLKASQPTI